MILNRDRFAILSDAWGRFRSLALISPIPPSVGAGDDGFLWVDIGVDGTPEKPVWKIWDEPAGTWRQIGGAAGTVDWDDVAGKPSAFPPEAHTHAKLVASDGDPDPALSVDATGRVTMGYGVTLSAGATVDEFSTDGTLGDSSDTAVPTEKAVRTYVDGKASGLITTAHTHAKLVASDGNPNPAVYCDNDGRFKANYGLDVTGTLTVSSTLTASDTIILANDASLRGRQFSLNDDTVLSFDPPNDQGVMLLYARNWSGVGALVLYRATTSPYCLPIAITSNVALGYGSALTNGTTDGVDGKFNIHTHTDGKIYLKNRLGGAFTFGLIFLGN